ncbi:MAG TPA: peptidoglycan-associated lipoprotein Pal [Terriglobales bacterium]|nr:peptidoglycan-associated lipoprotein Pal [Terriglobales bacterium]
MKQKHMKWAMLIVTMAAIITLGACKKKVQPPPPTPPPPPAAPTATLSANPSTIEKGQSTTLTWQTTNADDVTLGPNKVDANGSASVSPTESTTFRLIAKGPGGTKEETARVTVTVPPPPPPPQPTETDQELFNRSIKDVFFDYDSYEIRADAQASIAADAQFLQQHPNIQFTVEGHCDERGSTEYNLALGDNRANAVKTALVQAGVSADRIRTISFGKEKPFCTESNEQCWQQNRRGHLAFGK